MSEKKVQTMRFSDDELSLIKNIFAENEDLLRAIRKVMLQMPLDVIDNSFLANVTGKKEILSLIRKAFLPTIDPNAPRQQIVDLWMTIDLKDKSPEDAYPSIKARELLIKYLDQQLKVLEGTGKEEIKLNKFVEIIDKEQTFINLLARNTVINHIETILTQFIILAGSKEETVEKTLARLAKDSTK